MSAITEEQVDQQLQTFLDQIKQRDPHQTEFHQAATGNNRKVIIRIIITILEKTKTKEKKNKTKLKRQKQTKTKNKNKNKQTTKNKN